MAHMLACMPQVTRRILRGFSPAALVEARATAEYVDDAGNPHTGMSRGDVARLAGVSLTSLWNWEHGVTLPHVDTLARVAQALGVGMDRLVLVPESERTLADLRVLAGFTQPQLGKLAGLSTTAIGATERGEVLQLREDRAAAFAEALKVPVTVVRDAFARTQARRPGSPA